MCQGASQLPGFATPDHPLGIGYRVLLFRANHSSLSAVISIYDSQLRTPSLGFANQQTCARCSRVISHLEGERYLPAANAEPGFRPV